MTATAYSYLPEKAAYGDEEHLENRYLDQSVHADPFKGSDSTRQSLSMYPSLQASRPTATQPDTRSESMVYQNFNATPDYIGQQRLDGLSHADHHPIPNQYHKGSERVFAALRRGSTMQCSSPVDLVSFEPTDGSRELDIVMSTQRPPAAKRGPFRSNDERERTAETRKIGSCIRCRMQRIRVSNGPVVR